MRVAVGIPTYNRLNSLKRLVEGIKKFADMPIDLMVSIDGATDGTLEYVKANNIDHHYQQRQGVISVKNAILKKFRDYDYTFIIEDDIVFRGRGLFGMYIKAIKAFGIQHFNYMIPSQRVACCPSQTRDGITVMYTKYLGGSLSTFTKESIKKVGGFNPKFKGYGYGHCEYTLRASRAGLTSPWGRFAHVVNADKFIYNDNSINRSSADKKKIEDDKRRNGKILDETQSKKGLIHIPL